MISSNLIKLDDESMIEMGENSILCKMTCRQIHGIKINEFDFNFAYKLKIEDR